MNKGMVRETAELRSFLPSFGQNFPPVTKKQKILDDEDNLILIIDDEPHLVDTIT